MSSKSESMLEVVLELSDKDKNNLLEYLAINGLTEAFRRVREIRNPTTYSVKKIIDTTPYQCHMNNLFIIHEKRVTDETAELFNIITIKPGTLTKIKCDNNMDFYVIIVGGNSEEQACCLRTAITDYYGFGNKIDSPHINNKTFQYCDLTYKHLRAVFRGLYYNEIYDHRTTNINIVEKQQRKYVKKLNKNYKNHGNKQNENYPCAEVYKKLTNDHIELLNLKLNNTLEKMNELTHPQIQQRLRSINMIYKSIKQTINPSIIQGLVTLKNQIFQTIMPITRDPNDIDDFDIDETRIFVTELDRDRFYRVAKMQSTLNKTINNMDTASANHLIQYYNTCLSNDNYPALFTTIKTANQRILYPHIMTMDIMQVKALAMIMSTIKEPEATMLAAITKRPCNMVTYQQFIEKYNNKTGNMVRYNKYLAQCITALNDLDNNQHNTCKAEHTTSNNNRNQFFNNATGSSSQQRYYTTQNMADYLQPLDTDTILIREFKANYYLTFGNGNYTHFSQLYSDYRSYHGVH